MSWTLSGGPWRTGPEFSLDGATGKKLTVKRGAGAASSEATLDLSGRLRAAGRLNEMIDDVWLLHDGKCDWRARIGPSSESGTVRSQALSLTALDYRELLTRRLLFGPRFEWANTDPGVAFWQIIEDEQARPGSHLGIVRGERQLSGVVPSFNVEVGKPVREGIETLAGLGPGAHWDITPDPDDLLRSYADWWSPTRDRTRGAVVVKLGDAAVSYTRSVDPGAYGNSGRFTGQAPETPEGGTAQPAPNRIRIDVPDIADRPEGRWDYGEATDQTTDAGLLAYGQRSLEEHQLVPVTWTCKLRRGWWRGRSHLWVGDSVQWIARLTHRDEGGEYVFRDVDVVQPVEELQLEFDRPPTDAEVLAHRDAGIALDPDEPAVSITFGAPRRDAIRSMARRLRNLEQR